MGPGSNTAAGDLYGIGVRVGLYLQGIGMLLPVLRSARGRQTEECSPRVGRRCSSTYILDRLRRPLPPGVSGAGFKLACGAISISFLFSWTTLVGNRLISPCEAYLVLALQLSVVVPAKRTLFDTETIVGESIGLLALLIAELWVCVAFGWMFGQLYHKLPTLGTRNVVFFFGMFPISGWFRILMLVLCGIDWIFSIIWARQVLSTLWFSLQCYMDGKIKLPPGGGNRVDLLTDSLDDRSRRYQTFILVFLPSFLWVFAVATVEITIVGNNLSPTMDLKSPGQLIPLVTGIIAFANGSFLFFYPV